MGGKCDNPCHVDHHDLVQMEVGVHGEDGVSIDWLNTHFHFNTGPDTPHLYISEAADISPIPPPIWRGDELELWMALSLAPIGAGRDRLPRPQDKATVARMEGWARETIEGWVKDGTLEAKAVRRWARMMRRWAKRLLALKAEISKK